MWVCRPRGLLLAALCVGVQSNGEYEKGSDVVLYANKVRPCEEPRWRRLWDPASAAMCVVAQVGPFANPNEVYAFYSLPYCAPTEIETKRENLGALLKGDRPTKTRYDLKFLCAPPCPALPRARGSGRRGRPGSREPPTATCPRLRARPRSGRPVEVALQGPTR